MCNGANGAISEQVSVGHDGLHLLLGDGRRGGYGVSVGMRTAPSAFQTDRVAIVVNQIAQCRYRQASGKSRGGQEQ